MRAVTPRGRNSRLSFSILVWQLNLACLCKILRIRHNMCAGITLVQLWDPPSGGLSQLLQGKNGSNYAFLLLCICGRMNRGLVQWVHRIRCIPTWFLELTVNLVDFILSGYYKCTVHIGRACFISCCLFFTIMTNLINSTTKFTVDLFFWPHDFKECWAHGEGQIWHERELS